jgi:hypothetical protein
MEPEVDIYTKEARVNRVFTAAVFFAAVSKKSKRSGW